MRFIAPSTATKSPQRRLQEGQAIVLIALMLLVLFAMLGLAIDSGRAYVDRRDLQAAVDAAALAAGDWFENYGDLAGSTIPQSVQVYQSDLRLYSGWISNSHFYALVGVNANLPQDTYTYTYAENYTLTIVATNTQFNGYQFVFTVVHQLPLAFMQIFGGPTTVTITATATSNAGAPDSEHGPLCDPPPGIWQPNRPRRHLHERHRMCGQQPARGGELLRGSRLQLQCSRVLLLQLEPRLRAIRPGPLRRLVPFR